MLAIENIQTIVLKVIFSTIKYIIGYYIALFVGNYEAPVSFTLS